MGNPGDSDPDAHYTSIEFNWIKEFLKSSEARKILVVSDSCYSGVILRGTTTRLRNGTAEEHADYLRKAVQGRSRVAFSSGGVEEQALDEGGGDYSLFAAALIEALSNNRDPQPAEVLYQEIKQKVSVQADYQNHEQTPGYGEIKGADHGGGDFIFVPISALP